MRKAGTLALLVLVAGGLGFVLGRRTNQARTVAQDGLRKPAASEVVASRGHAALSDVGTAPSSGGPSDFHSESCGQLAVVVSLRKLGVSVNVAAFTHAPGKHTELTGAFVSLMGLSPAEVATIDGALASADDKIAQLSAAATEAHVDPATGNWVLHTPPFPEAGGAIHDQVFNAFSSTLGRDRMDAFNSLCPGVFDQMFDGFGSTDRTTTVSRIAPTATSPLLFKIVTAYTASALGGSGTSTSVMLGADAPQVAPLIPAFIPSSFFK